VLQRRGATLEVVSVELATGLEAWRRSLLRVEGAQIQADDDQLLVVTVSGGIDPTSTGIEVQAFDEETSDQRWSAQVSPSEIVSSAGRWLVIRPRPAADGTLLPGSVRVLDRRTGHLRWSRPNTTTADVGREEVVLADAGGLTLVTMSTGTDVGRYPDPGVARAFVAAPNELGVATQAGLVFPTPGGSSSQFIQVRGLQPSSARRLDDNVTLVSGGGSVMAIDRRARTYACCSAGRTTSWPSTPTVAIAVSGPSPPAGGRSAASPGGSSTSAKGAPV
jgi:outer membrane protein assembly factor BamB